MKRMMILAGVVCMLCCIFSSVALADNAGILMENELSAWLDQVLRETAGKAPLNAPVGEESLTEDGYAFLYDFATLYYNQPELNASSVLQAVSITDDNLAGPRGIALSSAEDALLSAYGWQNPYLMGDGYFAVFYRSEELPRAAYWSWAQHDENWRLTGVQCAMHVRTSSGNYTDAGIRYELTDGTVSGIRVYGLNKLISEADVRANLDALIAVENFNPMDECLPQAGYMVANSAAPFGADDLAFSGLRYGELTTDSLSVLLGQPSRTDRVQDSTGDWLVTNVWGGAMLTSTENNDGVHVDSLNVTSGAVVGPRGVCVGDSLERVLALFHSDGEGRVLDGRIAILYGDGVQAPYGLMEASGTDVTVSYALAGAEDSVTLYLYFRDQKLGEWMLYSW